MSWMCKHDSGYSNPLSIKGKSSWEDNTCDDEEEGIMKSFDTRPYVKRLKEAQQNPDIESAHAEADQVLCDLLEALGYTKIVEEYNKVSKWYA